jgi:hypothetical protein
MLRWVKHAWIDPTIWSPSAAIDNETPLLPWKSAILTLVSYPGAYNTTSRHLSPREKQKNLSFLAASTWFDLSQGYLMLHGAMELNRSNKGATILDFPIVRLEPRALGCYTKHKRPRDGNCSLSKARIIRIFSLQYNCGSVQDSVTSPAHVGHTRGLASPTPPYWLRLLRRLRPPHLPRRLRCTR